MAEPNDAAFYQRLSCGAPGATRLIANPAQVWVIATLEIGLQVGEAKYFISQLSSYALRNQRLAPEHREGYWAPPFVAYPAPIQFAPPSTLGSLAEQCDEAIGGHLVKRDMEQLAYRLGLRDVRLEEREGFVEVKVSPRSPEQVKAFSFRRYGLTRLSEDCIPNLADREGLLGFLYIPLSERHSVLNGIRRPSALHQRDELWVAGKPMQSNLEHVLSDGTMSAQIADSAIRVSIEEFSLRDRGVVVACDLSRYGSALKRARMSMVSFLGTGDEAAESFSQSVTHLLQQFVASLGTMQVQLAGDGVVAALPDRVGDGIEARLERILLAWERVVQGIEKLNERVPPDHFVGSRLGVHYGDYRHGRIAGPESVVAGFDGPAIVEAARLEHAISTIDAPVRHAAVVSDALNTRLRDDFLTSVSFTSLGRHLLTAKEFEAEAEVFGVRLEADA